MTKVFCIKSVVLFLLFIFSIFLIPSNPLAFCGQDVTFNMEQGTLGKIAVASKEDVNSITKKLGNKPERIDESLGDKFIKYPSRGIIMQMRGNGEIADISIYFRDVYESWESITWKPFTGNIMPAIKKNADMNTIIKIFGTPEKIDSVGIPPEIHYKKPYGRLVFCCNDDGDLELIKMLGY